MSASFPLGPLTLYKRNKRVYLLNPRSGLREKKIGRNEIGVLSQESLLLSSCTSFNLLSLFCTVSKPYIHNRSLFYYDILLVLRVIVCYYL